MLLSFHWYNKNKLGLSQRNHDICNSMLNRMRRSFGSYEAPAHSIYLENDNYYFCALHSLINREPLGMKRPSFSDFYSSPEPHLHDA